MYKQYFQGIMKWVYLIGVQMCAFSVQTYLVVLLDIQSGTVATRALERKDSEWMGKN